VFYRGGTLLLCGGKFSISTDSLSLKPEFEYGNNEQAVKLFILAYVKLLCDSPLEPTSARPLRSYKKFLGLLLDINIKDTIKRFSNLSHLLLSSSYVTGVVSTDDLYPMFKDTPIFSEFHSWVKSGRPELLKFMLTFLLFGKKLAYEDEEFHSTAFRQWEEVEERLRTLSFNCDDIATLRNIIAELLPPLPVDLLIPAFGPGKVSERGVRDVYDKVSNLTLHPRLAYAFDRARPRRAQSEGFADTMSVIQRSENSIEISRLKFVPKDITKSRSICMEPNSFMYFQQEVLRWMVRALESGPIKRFVTLADQSNSRAAAIHGSLYLSTDTIDLSSASDSVSVDLVKQVFPTDYLFYLLATRTSKVEVPDGRVVEVKKFAPMGSAVCFPVQCILFTAVCVYAGLLHQRGFRDGRSYKFSKGDTRDFINHRYFSSRTAMTPYSNWKYEPPVVYGDDIACDSRHTNGVISILTRLGFTVNVAKSFTGSQSFRESCGVYAFEGHDVTPVLYRLPSVRLGPMSAVTFASFIGQINWARDNGLRHLPMLLQSVLDEGTGKYQLPFVTNNDEFGIRVGFIKEPPPSEVRWNAEWHIRERRVQGIGLRRIKKPKPESLDLYRYDQWWRARVREQTSFEQSERLRIRPEETRLVSRWTRYE